MRITEKMLQARIDRVNEMTGNPLTYSEPREPGKPFKANVGNYHLSGAYGGVSLQQTCNEGGGVHDVFSCGHVPKRDLYDRINAFINGIQAEHKP